LDSSGCIPELGFKWNWKPCMGRSICRVRVWQAEMGRRCVWTVVLEVFPLFGMWPLRI
jgi:hypothetical protein